jgi:hypothetical protein
MSRTSTLKLAAALALVVIGTATPTMAQPLWWGAPGYEAELWALGHAYQPGYAYQPGHGHQGYGGRCLQDEGYGRFTPCDAGAAGG